jgi:hypothetical protein
MTDTATPAAPGTPATPGSPAIPGIPATPAAASAAPDLMTQMTQLTQSGAGTDTQFTDAARQKIIELITTFRDALTGQRGKAAALANYGDVGGLFGANDAKYRLADSVTRQPDGLLAVLDKYVSYLDQFEKTVNAAFARMQAEDNAT